MKTTTATIDQRNKTPPAVSVTARALRAALVGLGKTAPRSSPPRPPAHIKVSTLKSGAADLSSADGEHWTCLRIPDVASGPPGEFLVPIPAVKELLGGAKSDEPLDLSTVADRSGHGNADAFPAAPCFGGKAHTLKPGITQAITEAAACASGDPGRPLLNGVHLDPDGKDGKHIVATDGRVLYHAGHLQLPVSSPVTLSGHPHLKWKPFTGSGEWKFRLSSSGRSESPHYELTSGQWRITGKLLDGDYPAWRGVIPKKSEFKARALLDYDRLPELAKAIRGLPVATTQVGGHRPVAISGDANGKSLILRWHSAEDGAPCEMRAPVARGGKGAIEVLLDRDRLAAALSMGFEEMCVIDDISPVKFVGEGGRQMIVMPLRPGTTGAPIRKKPQRRPARTPTQAPTPRPKPKREPMPANTTRRTGANGTTPPGQPDKEQSPLDAALDTLVHAKESLRDAATQLGAAVAHLKQARRDSRCADREIRTVKSTLRSLRKVRL